MMEKYFQSNIGKMVMCVHRHSGIKGYYVIQSYRQRNKVYTLRSMNTELKYEIELLSCMTLFRGKSRFLKWMEV
jgi:hypothetical protein